MATESDKERIAGKLLLDPDFRAAFSTNPDQATQNIGIRLTAQEVENLRAFSKEDLESMVTQLDSSIGTPEFPVRRPSIGLWGKPPAPDLAKPPTTVINDIINKMN